MSLGGINSGYYQNKNQQMMYQQQSPMMYQQQQQQMTSQQQIHPPPYGGPPPQYQGQTPDNPGIPGPAVYYPPNTQMFPIGVGQTQKV